MAFSSVEAQILVRLSVLVLLSSTNKGVITAALERASITRRGVMTFSIMNRLITHSFVSFFKFFWSSRNHAKLCWAPWVKGFAGNQPQIIVKCMHFITERKVDFLNATFTRLRPKRHEEMRRKYAVPSGKNKFILYDGPSCMASDR